MNKFKLINEKLGKGVWITEYELFDIIKVLNKRNMKQFRKLVEDYEYLTENKFPAEVIETRYNKK